MTGQIERDVTYVQYIRSLSIASVLHNACTFFSQV
jgi:hypothetical protein